MLNVAVKLRLAKVQIVIIRYSDDESYEKPQLKAVSRYNILK